MQNCSVSFCSFSTNSDAKLQQKLNNTTKIGFFSFFFLKIDLNASNFKELAYISFIYVYLQIEIFLNI